MKTLLKCKIFSGERKKRRRAGGNLLPARRCVKLFYFAVGVLSHRSCAHHAARSVQAHYSAADSVSGLASVSDAVVSGVYSR